MNLSVQKRTWHHSSPHPQAARRPRHRTIGRRLAERDRARWDPTACYPNDNRMPLYGAAWCGKSWDIGRRVSPVVLAAKVETIRWLRGQGCSPAHKDNKGVTPANVCDMTYWIPDANKYKKAKPYEPPICGQLKAAMNAPM